MVSLHRYPPAVRPACAPSLPWSEKAPVHQKHGSGVLSRVALVAALSVCIAGGAAASSFSIMFDDIDVTTGLGAFLYTASGSATFVVNDDFDPGEPYSFPDNLVHGTYGGVPQVAVTTSLGLSYGLTADLFSNVPSGPFTRLGSDLSLGLGAVEPGLTTYGPDGYDAATAQVLVRYSDISPFLSGPVGSTGTITVSLEFGTEFEDFITGDSGGSTGEFGTGTASFTILESAPATIPLPASLPLLVAATGALALRRRRRAA